ncbi:MAG: helix-turn-helix domain-containing protein [Ilumatobacter sp.]|nr:MAG: helix-turn-helix domain-containing protein [Ilumatobacter sp.]
MMTFNVVGSGEVVIVLVELGLVEQRYQAVLEVLNDASTVTDVAVRFGVTRQTVHCWLRKYAAVGIAGLADGSARPLRSRPRPIKHVDRPSTADVDQLLLTITQASTILNIGRSTIYELIWAGQLTPVQLGRSVRFRRTDLEHFVDSMTGVADTAR